MTPCVAHHTKTCLLLCICRLWLFPQGYLNADPNSAAVQAMLLDLSSRVRQLGAVLVNL